MDIFVPNLKNMYRFPHIFLILLLLGCNTKDSRQTPDILVQKDINLLDAKDLKTMDFTDYALDRKAQNKLSNWMKYNELNNVITQIKKADLSHFKNDKEVVETSIKELLETLPEDVNTEPVKARVLAVQNMCLRLNNIVNLSTSSKKDIKKGIIDLLEAYSNLNFQINKKFERDAQNIIKP